MEQTNNKLMPEKAAWILKEDGLAVTLEEAEKISDSLRILAKIVVKHYLKKHENR